ncbi:hypothetical protein [Alteromonas mediterranea]|uniref:hypothetical protein n=1 Tax=Alteromonas mediterranea TaxID=314275 RepID=UPI001E467A15|nr:hypothetical protein [Alteromonas mediterranea]
MQSSVFAIYDNERLRLPLVEDATAFGLCHMDMFIMVTDKTMESERTLEYMCPYCGAINSFQLNCVRDMYHEQHESCSCCKKMLSLTPADGIGGSINLIVDESDIENVIK